MLEYFIYHYGTQIIAAILCAIFGCLGYAIKKLAVKFINDDTKRDRPRGGAVRGAGVEYPPRRGQAGQGIGDRRGTAEKERH